MYPAPPQNRAADLEEALERAHLATDEQRREVEAERLEGQRHQRRLQEIERMVQGSLGAQETRARELQAELRQAQEEVGQAHLGGTGGQDQAGPFWGGMGGDFRPLSTCGTCIPPSPQGRFPCKQCPSPYSLLIPPFLTLLPSSPPSQVSHLTLQLAARDEEAADTASKLLALSEYAHGEGERVSELQAVNGRLEEELRRLQPQLEAAMAELAQVNRGEGQRRGGNALGWVGGRGACTGERGMGCVGPRSWRR